MPQIIRLCKCERRRLGCKERKSQACFR
jgi:hypothetical protein